MVTKQRMTLEEYLALPEEKPYREYVCGEVVQKMAAQRSHATLVEEFLAFLRDYRRGGAGGFSGPETSILFDDPNDQRVLIRMPPIGRRASPSAERSCPRRRLS